jgi:hypothetical protein
MSQHRSPTKTPSGYRKIGDEFDALKRDLNLLRTAPIQTPGYQMLGTTPIFPGGMQVGTTVVNEPSTIPAVTGLSAAWSASFNTIRIDVTWTAPTGLGADQIVGYVVQALKTGAPAPLEAAVTASPGRIEPVEPNTTYAISVMAQSKLGTLSNPAVTSVTTGADTTAPAAPTFAAGAVVVGLGALSIKWNANTERDVINGAGLYRVVVSTASNLSAPVYDAKVGGTNVFVGTLTAGTSYYVGVYAIDSSGNSSPVASPSGGPWTPLANVINPGTITGTDLANGAVTTAKIATGAVTGATIAAATITAAQIAANTITSALIAANTIVGNDIAAGTITANNLAANSVTAASIAANTITAAQVAANTITAGQLAVTLGLSIGQFIQSSNYVTGTSGWRVDGDGNAEFSAITVRNSAVIGGTIQTATSGPHIELDSGGNVDKVNLETGSPNQLQQGYVYVYQRASGAQDSWILELKAPTVLGPVVYGSSPYIQLGSKSFDDTLPSYMQIGADVDSYLRINETGAAGGVVLQSQPNQFLYLSASDVSLSTANVADWVQLLNGTQISFECRKSLGFTDARLINLAPSSTDPLCRISASSGQLWIDSSSERFKTNITAYSEDLSLDVIDKLRVVTFSESNKTTTEMKPHRYVGFIAEEVAEVVPNLATYDADGRPFGVAYERFSALNTAGIQDLRARMTALEASVTH